MLLTITTTYNPATDLGYLLHKHPARLQTFDLSFGQAVGGWAADGDRCHQCATGGTTATAGVGSRIPLSGGGDRVRSAGGHLPNP